MLLDQSRKFGIAADSATSGQNSFKSVMCSVIHSPDHLDLFPCNSTIVSIQRPSSMTEDASQVVPAPSRGSRKIDLQDVMAVADAIRQQEIKSLVLPRNPSLKKTHDEDDPLQPLRACLNTPGVVEGLTTACFCIGVMLPVRQQILRLGRQRRMGDLLDLIVTPAMVLLSVQASLRMASLTGARTYLERVPLMDHDAWQALCSSDPTMHKLQAPPFSLTQHQDIEPSPSKWNPEACAFQALRKAIATCQQQGKY
jgi:hypothetical protein